MGFVYAQGFPTLWCYSDGENICVEECDGTMSKYKAPLRVRTERQLNTFDSPNACWYLQHEGVIYVGRFDGTFSGFDEIDGTLIRYGAWDSPFYRDFPLVGSYEGLQVHLDTRDMRTLYVKDKPHVFMLHSPYAYKPHMPAIAAAISVRRAGLCIFTCEEGMLDVRKIGTWVNTPTFDRRGNPVQL